MGYFKLTQTKTYDVQESSCVLLLCSCVCFEKYDFYSEQCSFHIIFDVKNCLIIY